MPKNPPKRLPEIDMLRGLAVFGMIIFHFFFILDLLQFSNHDLYSGWWLVLARSVQFTFLGLVGVSLAISRQRQQDQFKFQTKQSKRAITIYIMALLVSFATLVVYPQAYVKFGILHHIATAIIILAFIAHSRILPLLLAASSYFIKIFLRTITTDFLPLIILGATGGSFHALDHFPIFPWISVSAIGIFIGNVLFKNGQPIYKIQLKNVPPLSFLGQHALKIYILHIPLIYGLLLGLRSLL